MTDSHNDENCINIDSITKPDIPSNNGLMSNGSHKIRNKSITFSDTVSISESMIAGKNLNMAKKERVNSLQSNEFKSSHLPCPTVGLVILMLFVVIILQVPTALYYTDLPSADIALLLDGIDLGSCTVS